MGRESLFNNIDCVKMEFESDISFIWINSAKIGQLEQLRAEILIHKLESEREIGKDMGL